jgi:uncharacterized protein YcfJ
MTYWEKMFHTCAITWGATFLIAVSGAAHANQTQVADITDHYKTVIQQEPYTVEVCKDVQVPYGNKKEFDQEGAIIGGIIGGVIGNQFGKGSGKEAATGVGALTGAIIGGNKDKGPQGYKTQTVCNKETRYKEKSKEVYSHSTITFWLDGNKRTLKFNR